MEITEYSLNGVTIKKTDKDLCWRLIHDGTYIFSLSEDDGELHTKEKIFLAKTFGECKNEIEKLGLIDREGKTDGEWPVPS